MTFTLHLPDIAGVVTGWGLLLLAVTALALAAHADRAWLQAVVLVLLSLAPAVVLAYLLAN